MAKPDFYEEKTTTVVDSVDESGNIHVKTITRILKNGTSIGAPQLHRHVVTPEDTLDNEDAKVVVVANAVRTPSIMASSVAQAKVKFDAIIEQKRQSIAELDALIVVEQNKIAELQALQEQLKELETP
jgi:hypothetical protein